MATTFFGFALADSMFDGDACMIRRIALTATQAYAVVAGGVESCLNPSHKATIEAMKWRFGFEVAIPAKPPQVSLALGDRLLVMGVRGLPRLTDRHEYSDAEVAEATFKFSLYEVVG